LSDLAVAEAIDGDFMSVRPSSLALGPPPHEHGRMLPQIQERLGLKLKGALGHSDEFLQKSDDIVPSAVVPGRILIARLMPADLVGEERTDRIPVAARTSLVELTDGPFLRIHAPILKSGTTFTSSL
jgi:hypothetical protein